MTQLASVPRISVTLDVLRWTSAWLVLFGHVMHLVHHDRAPQWHEWSGWGLLWTLGNLSHASVIVFFVLSGYLVGGKVFTSVAERRFEWTPYLINRISRLYTVLLVALPLGVLWDVIGLTWCDPNGIYRGQFGFPILSYAIDERLTWIGGLSNLFQLQTIFSPPLGSNGPLWSLAYEWWYYVLCPLLAWSLTRNHLPLGQRILALVGFASVGWLVGSQILLYGLLWLLGAASAQCRWPRLPRPGWWLLGLGILMIAIGTDLLHHLTDLFPGRLRAFGADAVLAFMVAGLLQATAQRSLPSIKTRHARVHRFLADYSYSLYLTHFPFCLLLVCVVHQWLGTGLQSDPSLTSLALVCLVMVAAHALALAVAWATEFRTTQVRNALCTWLIPTTRNP